jgi:hypothetical protein
MSTDVMRGSEKLIAGAWNARVISEESVAEIARHFEESPGSIESANVVGGQYPTGLRLSVRYDGDDGPYCGNDILYWLRWHVTHGGVVNAPRIIVNGTPFPDLVQMELDFGHVGGNVPGMENITGALALGEFGA